ncbi:hypothetical protein [Pseudomonas sp. W03]|uniref:hypothetical protein n=1 Tax=Pseudomonas sp. W03 TaxID=3090666 RepID=UPI003A4DB4EE
MYRNKPETNRAPEALQVYLDSNDYSNFSDPKKRDLPSFRDTKNRLKKLVSDGKIIIRHSMISVIEAAPLNRSDIQTAGLRFSCIKELCGKSTLINPFDLLENELKILASCSTPYSILLSNGHWMPPLDDIKIPNPKVMLSDEISKLQLNRQQRRAAKKIVEGSYKDKAGEQEALELARQIPVNKPALIALRKYMAGDSPKSKVIDALKDSFSDLDLWERIYYDYWDSASSASAWLRTQGGKLDAMLNEFSASIKGLYGAAELNGIPESDVKRLARAANKNNRNKFFSDISHKLAENFEINLPSGTLPTWEKSPGLYTLIALYFEKLKEKSLDLRASSSGKISDFGDIMHAIYLPYVDIFRCDKATANLIRRAIPQCGVFIPANLNDLILGIEERV